MKTMQISEPAAAELVKEVLDSLDGLCDSASVVRKNCDAETFEAYRLIVANTVSDVADAMLEPIFLTHPHLRP
jgi:hypothetical protein